MEREVVEGLAARRGKEDRSAEWHGFILPMAGTNRN
jgi:hypothetical protein